MQPTVPATSSADATRMSIAWLITITAYNAGNKMGTEVDNRKRLTDAYNEVYSAILKNERALNQNS